MHPKMGVSGGKNVTDADAFACYPARGKFPSALHIFIGHSYQKPPAAYVKAASFASRRLRFFCCRDAADYPQTGQSPAASYGQWTQVSRLGMPLVNEVVIGRDDKDRFNGSLPYKDVQFADYVTNPTLPALVQTLFPTAKAPTNFPRTDLVTVFLKGIDGLNQPKTVVPSEMLRLNTAIAPTSQGQQNALGVAAGDKAGFPNGRRPGDDVVDLSIRVAMGALCVLTGPTDALKVGCKPSDAPAGALAFTDGVRRDAKTFQGTFPYLNTPISGSFNNF